MMLVKNFFVLILFHRKPFQKSTKSFSLNTDNKFEVNLIKTISQTLDLLKNIKIP